MRIERECATPPPIRESPLIPPALRLYPSVPINVRIAQKTTWLPRGGGPDGDAPLLVRRGTGVGFLAYYLHRRRDLYGDDADEFRPERWEEPELANIGWGYIPFHGGPRLCLGSKFAPLSIHDEAGQTLTMFRGFRIDGSLLRRRPNHANIPKHPVATKLPGRAYRSRKADADRLPLQHRRLQGDLRLARTAETKFLENKLFKPLCLSHHAVKNWTHSTHTHTPKSSLPICHSPQPSSCLLSLRPPAKNPVLPTT